MYKMEVTTVKKKKKKLSNSFKYALKCISFFPVFQPMLKDKHTEVGVHQFKKWDNTVVHYIT